MAEGGVSAGVASMKRRAAAQPWLFGSIARVIVAKAKQSKNSMAKASKAFCIERKLKSG